MAALNSTTDLMRELVTTRLVLEPLSATHADEMYAVLGDPSLYRYLDSGPPESIAQLRSRYVELEGRTSPDGSQQWLNWILRISGSECAIGFVQATVGSSLNTWVAYRVGARYQGRGYATEGTRAMLAYLADACAVRRCLATVEVENRSSIRLLTRLGFQTAEADELARHELTATERLYVRSSGVRSSGGQVAGLVEANDDPAPRE